MRKILFPTLLLLLGCGREFEPDLTGWKAYTYPGRKIYLEINQRKKTIELPGDEHVGYRYAQWTAGSQLVVTQLTKTNTCFDYQIITIDTTGNILDTVYKAPVNTALNFKLAPNDSLMLLKTYIDNCDGEEGSNYQYTFYNRYLKKAQYDTIVVGSSRGIPLQETIWSPNSKKVIISEWSGFLTEAFTYDLTTKDTTYIDIGGNFQWSPTDHEVVAYIKDHSIYTKNIRSGEKELIYQGKEKKSVTDFRWSPRGDFLMIHLKGYVLNIKPFANLTVLYFSLKDKQESSEFRDVHRIDTWRNSPDK